MLQGSMSQLRRLYHSRLECFARVTPASWLRENPKPCSRIASCVCASGEKCLGWALLHDNAPVDEHGAVGRHVGKSDLVGHHHHGHAPLGEAQHHLSTSLTISGSSAEVGSSNSITFG